LTYFKKEEVWNSVSFAEALNEKALFY